VLAIAVAVVDFIMQAMQAVSYVSRQSCKQFFQAVMIMLRCFVEQHQGGYQALTAECLPGRGTMVCFMMPLKGHSSLLTNTYNRYMQRRIFWASTCHRW
jgi:hypothetical protein